MGQGKPYKKPRLMTKSLTWRRTGAFGIPDNLRQITVSFLVNFQQRLLNASKNHTFDGISFPIITIKIETKHAKELLMFRLLSTFLILLCFSLPVASGKPSTKQCQSWQKKIEHYTKQRQRGGSASKMNKWQKARKKYKARYEEGGCAKSKSLGSL